jgi:hypothetical protein
MTKIINDEKFFFENGLAVLDLTFAEWETSKEYTREEVVKIGKDMYEFDYKITKL